MSNGNWSQEELLNKNPASQNRELDSVDDEALWELFSVYADGEATPEEVAKIEAMLLSNPALSTELNFMQISGEGARNVVEIEPPLSLTESILAKTSHRKTFLQKAQSWLAAQNRVLAPGVYRYSFAAGVSLLLMTAWFASQRNVKPGILGKTANIAINHATEDSTIPAVSNDKMTKEVVINTPSPIVGARKQSVTPPKNQDVTQLKSASLVQTKIDDPSAKLVKIDASLSANDGKAKSVARNSKVENTANVAQNLNTLNPHLEQTHNNMASKESTDPGSETTLGHSVDTPLVSSNSSEAPPAVIDPETIQPKTTVASILSAKVNHYAPDSGVMAVSFTSEAKRMLEDARRELRAETASNRQYKADIIKGSF